MRTQGNRAELTGPFSGHQPWALDAGQADVAVAADLIPSTGLLGSLVLRATSGANYLRLAVDGQDLIILRVQNGDGTVLTRIAHGFTPGQSYHLEARASGSQITGYVNGVLRLTATETFQQTATLHGMSFHADDYQATFDNFEVRALSGPPVITGPADQTFGAGTAVSVPIVATDPEGQTITYGASGLPAGLIVNTSTGVISGTVAALPGTYASTVTASDGTNTSTRNVNWTITSPPPQGVLVFDTFTGPNGTLLTSHPLDIAPSGSTWTYVGTGTSQVRTQGNRAELADPGSGHQPWAVESGQSDVAVAVDFRPDQGLLGSIVLRATTGANYLRVAVDGQDLVILRMQNGDGTVVTRMAHGFGPGQWYHIEARASGSQITAYVDGVLRLTATETFQQTATRHGLSFHSADYAAQFDTFEVRAMGTIPSISSLSQTMGGVGQNIAITGANFGATQGTNTVRFNGTPASVTAWSTTSITAAVPSGATTGPVVVTVAGQNSNGVTFTVIPPPSISSLSPSMGPAGAAVAIDGSNFGSTQWTSTVRFNDLTAAVTTWSSTSITATVPAGTTTGPVVVTVAGLTSNGSTFTATSPAITGMSPQSGAAGTAVTISGANFGATQSSSAVTFNGVPAWITSWSATSIGVVVPNSAATGPLVVTVSGQSSNGPTFVVTPTGAIVWDTFTGANGSLLPGHAPDIAPAGVSWMYVGGGTSSVRIQGNRIELMGREAVASRGS